MAARETFRVYEPGTPRWLVDSSTVWQRVAVGSAFLPVTAVILFSTFDRPLLHVTGYVVLNLPIMARPLLQRHYRVTPLTPKQGWRYRGADITTSMGTILDDARHRYTYTAELLAKAAVPLVRATDVRTLVERELYEAAGHAARVTELDRELFATPGETLQLLRDEHAAAVHDANRRADRLMRAVRGLVAEPEDPGPVEAALAALRARPAPTTTP